MRIPTQSKVCRWLAANIHEINYEAFLLKYGLMDWLLRAAWRRWLLFPIIMGVIAVIWLVNLIAVILLASLWTLARLISFRRV